MSLGKLTRRIGLLLPALLAPPALAGTSAVTVTQGWIRYLLPSLPAAAYLTLHNGTAAPVVLAGAASPACGTLMLHESSDTSGMAMMMAVPSITVPAGGSVSFAPGGYHLMCMQPKMAVGSKVSIKLNFQGGTSTSASLPVYGATGAP